jgi:hypothetical protein
MGFRWEKEEQMAAQERKETGDVRLQELTS